MPNCKQKYTFQLDGVLYHYVFKFQDLMNSSRSSLKSIYQKILETVVIIITTIIVIIIVIFVLISNALHFSSKEVGESFFYPIADAQQPVRTSNSLKMESECLPW